MLITTNGMYGQIVTIPAKKVVYHEDASLFYACFRCVKSELRGRVPAIKKFSLERRRH